MAHKSGVPATTNPFGTISKRSAVVPMFVFGYRHSWELWNILQIWLYQACIHQIFSVIMVLLLLELILKVFQHVQEFAKCASGLGEVVVLMAHSLWMDTTVAAPALPSQSSALPCCALSHPHRHTVSGGQGHSKCNRCVSKTRTSCVCSGGEKEKEWGQECEALGTL